MLKDKKEAGEVFRKYYLSHKKEICSRSREWAIRKKQENPEAFLKKARDYYHTRKNIPEVKNRTKEKAKLWKLNNPEKSKLIVKNYRERNREKIKLQAREIRSKIKQEVFFHYGNGNVCCARCGFSDIRALQLDHINNNGAAERLAIASRGNMDFPSDKKYGATSLRMYRYLKKNGYPKGYQVLCANCNLIKEHEYRRTLGDRLLSST